MRKLFVLLALFFGVTDAFLSSEPLYRLGTKKKVSCPSIRPAKLSFHENFQAIQPQDETAVSLSSVNLSSSFLLPLNGLLRKLASYASTVGKIALRELQALSPTQKGLFAAVFLLGVKLGAMDPFWRRMTSVLDIPTKYFGSTARTFKGRVVSVSDGDTVRFLHVPTPFNRSTLKKKEKISEAALPIRLCTIDTPETAKFGKSGQPFGIEAKEKMKELVDQKMVRIRLLQKDQYGRAVAELYTGWWPFRKAADEQMLREGLAEVYQGGGAVYGSKGKDAYLDMEKIARKAKLGIWGQKNRESAAEYKRRTK